MIETFLDIVIYLLSFVVMPIARIIIIFTLRIKEDYKYVESVFVKRLKSKSNLK